MEVQNQEMSWHPQDVILSCDETVRRKLTSFGKGGNKSREPHVVCLGAVPCKWNQVPNREFYILLNILKFGYDAVKYEPGSCHHEGALRRRQGVDLMALFVFLMKCPRNMQQNCNGDESKGGCSTLRHNAKNNSRISHSS